MKKFFLFIILCFAVCIAWAGNVTKVACVGNSVTYGYLLPDREINAYPFQLQRLLGESYEVKNFGHSGTTLLSKGHRPYIRQPEYKEALKYAADIVVIHLGLNDTDPRNWPNYRDDFVKDYLNLIADFRKANPKCEVYICRMSPIADRHPRFCSGTRDWYGKIQKAIENIAAHSGVGLIDLEGPLFHRPDLLPDALHPNVEGAAIMARTAYAALTGDYGGLQMPLVYSDHMVLQRDIPLQISGTANAGEEVTVKIGFQKLTTWAGKNGKWKATLSPLQAGGPYDLEIRTKRKTLTFRDVLVGEVWICSGQSNMAFKVKQAITAKEDLKNASRNDLRLFNLQPRWETYAVQWNASVLDSLNRLQYYKTQGWQISNPVAAADFSAVAYHFGKMLADSLKVPVGLIHNAVGGSPCEAWIDRKTLNYELPEILKDWTRNDMIQDWVRGRAALNVKKSANKNQRHPYEPCYLFEAGIVPLEAYPSKGVVWYQGESNAHNMEIYEILFPMLVKSWRQYWHNPEMPFYYVQLSGLNRPSWPWFRDSQRRMLEKIPYSGMAVSSDVGDSLDVHPRYKKEVGERLARWALNQTYRKDILPSGPLYRSVSIKEDRAILTFDYAKGLHAAGGAKLQTFEVAGADGVFYPAEAVIDEEQVVVRSSQVRNPRIVRYSWQPFTRANLVNADGLPASTFRTDEDEIEYFPF